LTPSKLQAEVRVENLEGGTSKFPHVYGPLLIEAVVNVDPISVGHDDRLLVECHLAGPR